MIINHNLSAMNAQRQLNISGIQRTKSSEKLSSGYRINRSADDAAGLTISEKMRSQIRGLDQGSRNVQDGISLLQVADGALNEVHDMLHRMNELSIQAANDTNNIEDREAIQQEIDQLSLEIDRISDTTSFNGRLLFKGNDTTIERTETDYGTITGYKTEKTSTSVVIPHESSFSFSVTGTSTDSSAKTYRVDGYAGTNKFRVGTDDLSYSVIKDSNGDSILGLSEIKAGTYSFDYKGMTVSIEVDRDVSFAQFKSGIDGLSFNTKRGAGDVYDFSLTVSSDKDYENITTQAIYINVENNGIRVGDTLYNWPDSLSGTLTPGSTYNIDAGNLHFKLNVGSSNNVSLEKMVSKMGRTSFMRYYHAENKTAISGMSLSRSSADWKRTMTSNEIKKILITKTDSMGRKYADPEAYIHADEEGIWYKIGDNTTEKKSWADIGVSTTATNRQYTYTGDGLSFSFTPQYEMTVSELANLLDGIQLEFGFKDPGTYLSGIKLNNIRGYYGDYISIGDFSESEAANWYKMQGFSISDPSEGIVLDAVGERLYENETSFGSPYVPGDPEIDKIEGYHFYKDNSNLLAIDINGKASDRLKLQNPSELRNYFNNRTGSIDLVFKNSSGRTLKFKLNDKLYNATYGMTASQFVDAITDSVSSYNQKMFGLVFPNYGDNELFTYYYRLTNSYIEDTIRYGQVADNTSVFSKNIDERNIVADRIINTPSYTYTEVEGGEEEIQIPIYGEKTIKEKVYQENKPIWIQSSAGIYDGMFITTGNMNSKLLGVNKLNVLSHRNAENAIDSVSNALGKLSELRSHLGAQQNRLEHTFANVTNMEENAQAAESRIRDTDMAKEMVEQSKLNILSQMGTMMLSQANQSHQSVLQLLQ